MSVASTHPASDEALLSFTKDDTYAQQIAHDKPKNVVLTTHQI